MSPTQAVPHSTYRVQLNAAFGFAATQAIVGYLNSLGIGALYSSPILQARRGSTHGYDVTDPQRLSAQLGGQPAFDRLAAELTASGMGLVADLVPNHMAASSDNKRWMDVLRTAHRSRHARFFDIDWDDPVQGGKVLVPILGEPYGRAVERGDVTIQREGRALRVAYFDHRLPLAPGTAAEPARGAAADAVLARQRYRLGWWKAANLEINYRRFFDIADLVCVRVEDPDVFAATHELALRLVREGKVTGLRIDHIDGLYDPAEYLHRLREAMGGGYVVVEKILSPSEELPRSWPTAGTTGYEFANALNDVFVDPDGLGTLTRSWADVTGCAQSFETTVHECKRQVLSELFATDVARLARSLQRAARDDLQGRDLTVEHLTEALVEVTVRLPVYRTYVREPVAGRGDRSYIDGAVGQAAAHLHPDARPALAFLARVLCVERPEWTPLVGRWQQLTGPAMAKGLEDTALYRYTPFVSRNDVGSDPGLEPGGVDGFHQLNASRLRRQPGGLSSTTTHDSKRSEDVRARINVISELAEEWIQAVRRWTRRNRDKRTLVHGEPVPDARTELVVYQTLAGIWPLDEEGFPDLGARLKSYMVKASREAKRDTSWTNVDPAYERALESFIDAILADRGFRDDFERVIEPLAYHGALSSVGQVILKVAAPGVPDVYQGTELWHLRLVDPDNREPVDFARLAALHADVERADPAELLETWQDGRIKLYVTARALHLRSRHPDVLLRGRYLPLSGTGLAARHLCAFARVRGRTWVVAAVPRLTHQLMGAASPPVGPKAWRRATVELPADAPTRWHDVLTGERVDVSNGRLRLADVFRRLPFALLEGSPHRRPAAGRG